LPHTKGWLGKKTHGAIKERRREASPFRGKYTKDLSRSKGFKRE